MKNWKKINLPIKNTEKIKEKKKNMQIHKKRKTRRKKKLYKYSQNKPR